MKQWNNYTDTIIHPLTESSVSNDQNEHLYTILIRHNILQQLKAVSSVEDPLISCLNIARVQQLLTEITLPSNPA